MFWNSERIEPGLWGIKLIFFFAIDKIDNSTDNWSWFGVFVYQKAHFSALLSIWVFISMESGLPPPHTHARTTYSNTHTHTPFESSRKLLIINARTNCFRPAFKHRKLFSFKISWNSTATVFCVLFAVFVCVWKSRSSTQVEHSICFKHLVNDLPDTVHSLN